MAKLSLEEFKELRAQGLDTEQIVSFEDRRRTEIKETKSKASLLDFIKKDLFTGGVTDEETPSGIKGFAADVFRTTIGSKGIAGSGQLLGRTLSTTGFPLISKGSAKERVELEESRGGLSDLTTKLIERYDVQPEGLEREKMKKIILNNIKEMGLSSEASKKLEEQVVSGREIASTTIRAGTQAALLATPIQSTIKGAIAEGAIGTGLLGAADAIEDGDDAKTIAKKTFRNAMIGGAIAGTLKGVQKLATGVVDYATKNAPKQLMNMALHTTKKIRESGKGIQQLLDDKVFGTLGTIQNKINAGIETVNTNISNALSGSKRKVVSKTIFNKVKTKAKEAYGKTLSNKRIDSLIDGADVNILRHQDSILVDVLNKTRIQLDKLLKDSFFTEGEKAPQRMVNGMFRDVIAEEVKSIGGQAVRNDFAIWSRYIEADDIMSNAVAIADKKFGIGAFDYIVGLGGFAGGGTGGALTGLAVKKSLESPFVQTGAAISLQKLGKFIEKIPTDQLNQVGRTSLINMINEMMKEGKE